MPAVLATVSTVPTVTQNSLHPLSISSITAWHLLGFMVHGKITEADTPKIRLDATPSRLSVIHLHHSPIYTPDALSAATLPLYPGLGQMTVHTQSLMTMIPWGGGVFEQIVAASCVTEINFHSLCCYSFVIRYLCQLTHCRTYNPETDQVKIGWRYMQKAPADGSYLWQLVVKQLTQLAKLWAVCPFWWQ